MDSVVVLVIGRSGTCPVQDTGLSNLFPSTFHSLVDNEGQSIGPKDFGQDTYQQLVELFSMPADWVLNQSIGSGELNK